MGMEVAVVLNNRIARYVKTRQTEEKDRTPSELVGDLLNEWYDVKVRKLHRQYLAGDLTLRGMARRLGLEYRELYELLEAKGLTV